ncbi:MAG: hypothetical protein QNJ46_14285 [Leptolyngbyaceae cyanobacterium MO_188.B28]|nr:hypothetical protein [Leptolyngbyaceae cyanobacterium MO_188.B28]
MPIRRAIGTNNHQGRHISVVVIDQSQAASSSKLAGSHVLLKALRQG